MSTTNNGGPAFPCEGYVTQSGEVRPVDEAVTGMTLRDYFAAKAMPHVYNRIESGGFERVARLAYEMADAMLAARESE
jgi:hypothetical protein